MTAEPPVTRTSRQPPAAPPGGADLADLDPAAARSANGGPPTGPEAANADPVTGGEADEDTYPAAPLFFLSYAHLKSGHQVGEPREPDERVLTFFDDLSSGVADLVSRQAGDDPGFMDRSLLAGDDWSEELLENLGTCQVFVALMSASYVTSESCGQEWFAFAQRRVIQRRDGVDPRLHGRAIHRKGIIPVRWAPFPDQHIPPRINKVQRFTPTGVPNAEVALYRTEGIVGLMRTTEEAAYNRIVWRIAQCIANFHYSYRVEPGVLDASELRNAFRKEAT
jgi:hypothetical protein